MCTRTKTSWGCGCAYKATAECYSRSCPGIDRFHLLKDGDCAECKRGGNRVTRGREGKGRYAQELKLREARPPVTRPPLAPISTNVAASPWAPPRSREKEWRSPVRQRADDAWLVEHERRQRDLEAKTQRLPSRAAPSSPTNDYAWHWRGQDETRRADDEGPTRVRRRAERSNSYDSFYTMDSSHSPSRGRTFDSGFHHSPSPSIPHLSSHRSPRALGHGLGHGLGDVVRDSARPQSRG